MNDYKIIYIIESLNTEHIRYISADSEESARDLFLSNTDQLLFDSNKLKILSVTRVPEVDETCYGSCNCDSC